MRIIAGAVFAGLLACPALALAERGWYAGVDVAQLQTTLDYGATETYVTSHLRFKGGYQILDFLSVEGRVMVSGHDTDTDIWGNQFRFDTGSMLGVYARPHTNFQTANVYGIVGLTVMDSRYRSVALGIQDSDMLFLPTIGVGGDFRVARQLSLTVEAQYFVGTAGYNTFFADYVDVYGFGVGAGVRYRF